MALEYSQAISFANSYFALVDGLAYGLEDYLAEDVSLDWFGKIVRGRVNVAAFMRINMPYSTHIFNIITPTSSIGPRKRRALRRKHKGAKNSAEDGDANDGLINKGLDFSKLCIDDADSMVNDEKLEPKGSSVKRDENQDELRIVQTQNMECEPCQVSAIRENDPVKFIRAYGDIQIHRSTRPNKIRGWKSFLFNSGLPGGTCRRHCKLQVAYSLCHDKTRKTAADPRKSKTELQKITEPSNHETKIKACESNTMRGRKRLNSDDNNGDEKLKAIMGLEAFINPFEGFDPVDERKRFLECFDAEITEETAKFNFTSPKYMGNRLVFDRIKSNQQANQDSLAGFKFNYFIRSIIYEGDRKSTSGVTEDNREEFEDRKSLSDTEKRL